MEVSRSVIALDYGDGAAGPEQLVQNRQRINGMRKVFQDEADENMVEGLRVERQGEDISAINQEESEMNATAALPVVGVERSVPALVSDVRGRDA